MFCSSRLRTWRDLLILFRINSLNWIMVSISELEIPTLVSFSDWDYPFSEWNQHSDFRMPPYPAKDVDYEGYPTADVYHFTIILIIPRRKMKESFIYWCFIQKYQFLELNIYFFVWDRDIAIFEWSRMIELFIRVHIVFILSLDKTDG